MKLQFLKVKSVKSLRFFKIFAVILAVILFLFPFIVNDWLQVNQYAVVIASIALPCIFMLGRNAYKSEFFDVFTMPMLGIYLGTTVLIYLAYSGTAQGNNVHAGNNIMNVSILLLIIITAILINQSNLHDQLQQKKYQKTLLPSRFSTSNILTTFLFIILVIFLFSFLGIIIDFLNSLFSFIIAGIAAIIENIGGKTGEVQYSGNDFVIPDVLVSNSKFGFVIVVLITIAIAITVFIVFRRQIVDAFKGLLERIILFLTGRNYEQKKCNTFIDHYEIIVDKHRTRKISKRSLMKQYRHEQDLNSKFRIGYRIMLWKMDKNNINISKADTAKNHCQKYSEHFNSNVSEIKQVYEQIRYGDGTVNSAQIEILDKIIR